VSESVLLSEIAEQPSVLERLLTEAAPDVEAIAAAVRAGNIHHVVIAARGSSTMRPATRNTCSVRTTGSPSRWPPRRSSRATARRLS